MLAQNRIGSGDRIKKGIGWYRKREKKEKQMDFGLKAIDEASQLNAYTKTILSKWT